MIDRNPEKNKKGTLPEFTPVPRHYNRHDGWTPERQRGFIEALAETGSVRAAARAVNMAPEGAYQLRRHPQAGEFRKAWEAALACGVQRLEDIAMDRALNGVEVPIYSYGKLLGMRIVHNDRLLMFLLRNRAPKRFAEGGGHRNDAATQGQLKRLRAQWQKEWEEERERNTPSPEEICASIERKVEAMKQRVLRRQAEEEARASEKTRQLHAAWQESVAEDERLRAQGLLPGPVEDAEGADCDETDADPDEAHFETPYEPTAEPSAPSAPEEAKTPRIISVGYPWPNDGRATPWYGR